ncbi:hypothetical protein Gotur_021901 [Gossypium turneri]
MDSAMLVSLILPTVKADPRTSMPVLIVNIRSQMGYMPSYRKAWIAKQKALEKMHSGWDASYNKIWYTHRLLLAVAQDGGGRILPIAFAITSEESSDDWDFFLSRLRRHVCPQLDIYVISDRGTSILATFDRQESLWQRTHHRYYLRHVASNYYRQYLSKSERRQVTNMGYEINVDCFHKMLAVLRSINGEGTDYLCNIRFKQWAQAYDGDLRYGHMTSSLDECKNFVIKGTRHLPITSVV